MSDKHFSNDIVYHQEVSRDYLQYLQYNYSCILNMENKSYVTKQTSNLQMHNKHISKLLLLFGFKRFIFDIQNVRLAIPFST